MKIMVAVKRVLDFQLKPKLKADGTDVDLTSLKMSMNPFDEIAVEEAVRLKEKGVASEIVVVAIGGDASQETLRAALALGADRAILVKAESKIQPLQAAKLLKAVAGQEQPKLIILGKQAIDDDSNQTGQMLAALLDWPQGTFAYKLELQGESASVTREVDGGLQTHQLTLPAVVTTDLRLNEPRYAALPNIMKARQKPLAVHTPADLGVETSGQLRILNVEEPPRRKGGVKVASIDELLDKLKNEARVLR